MAKKTNDFVSILTGGFLIWFFLIFPYGNIPHLPGDKPAKKPRWYTIKQPAYDK